MSMIAKLNPFSKKTSFSSNKKAAEKISPLKEAALSRKPVLKDITREQSFWDNAVLS